MFVVGTSAPQLSGMSPAAKRATMELVMLAYNAANELCDTQGDALSKSFANFDRVVALGWLLGDAMGARLLLREQAYAVGLKARKAAVALKVDVVAKKKAVQRRYAGLLWSTSGPKGPRRRKRRRVPANPGRRAGDAARETAAERAVGRAAGDLPPRPPPEASVGSRLKRRCDPARQPRPAHAGTRVGPAHGDAIRAVPAVWPRRVASNQVAPRLLPKASMLPGGTFGPQVGRGRVGDGPKVFSGCDAASAVLGGSPLAIRFFSLLITPLVRGGWVLKSVAYTERCSIDL